MRRISVAFQLGRISGSLGILLAAPAGAPDLRAAESLQTFVSHLMREKAGAVIVSDPRTVASSYCLFSVYETLNEGRIVGAPTAAFKTGSLLIASITFLAI